MAQTKVVLLERVESLGNLGDVVAVRPGYARNYLLPQKKALRASKENIAYFEAQRKTLEADNESRRKDAEKLAKKLENVKIPLIRQAAEGGQLYGSVTARDIALEISEILKEKIDRSKVQLNQSYKMIGLFPVTVMLHPEVRVEVTINIARTNEEAEVQAKTGKALIVEEGGQVAEAAEEGSEDEQLEDVLDDSALEARKEKKKAEKPEAGEEETAEAADADEESAEKKEKKKPAKKAAAKKPSKKAKDEE